MSCWPVFGLKTHAAPRVHVNLELTVVFSSWDKASGDTIIPQTCVCVCVCSQATETTIGLAGLQKYNQLTQKYILQHEAQQQEHAIYTFLNLISMGQERNNIFFPAAGAGWLYIYTYMFQHRKDN